ncbi:MAG: hypothetical protein HN350_00765 [Phycisphaerales bacterium]|jgi:hypothetical protein|nr:hypothetical protein [Phycisphaerales bacterium]
MIKLRQTSLVLLALLLVAAGGCTPPIPNTQITLGQLVSEYNTNASGVKMLAAYAEIDYIEYHDITGLGLTLWSSPNGLLRMKKGKNPLAPGDMVLIGREMSQQVMRVGTSLKDKAYYMWALMPKKLAMWGHLELAGAPGIRQLPIDPTGLQAVLGICQLPADQSKTPAVTLQMDTTPGEYAYVLRYVNRQPVSKHLLQRREYRFTWGDDKPRRLEEVNFYNALGRKVMTAEVSDYQPIDIASMTNPPAAAPVMPTDITITWFNDRQQKTNAVHLKLSQMTTDEEMWDIEVCEFLSNLPSEIPAQSVIQVDKAIPLKKKDKTK